MVLRAQPTPSFLNLYRSAGWRALSAKSAKSINSTRLKLRRWPTLAGLDVFAELASSLDGGVGIQTWFSFGSSPERCRLDGAGVGCWVDEADFDGSSLRLRRQEETRASPLVLFDLLPQLRLLKTRAGCGACSAVRCFASCPSPCFRSGGEGLGQDEVEIDRSERLRSWPFSRPRSEPCHGIGFSP